ncbi:hypothetical protein D3C81_1979410 [compost metagenome]
MFDGKQALGLLDGAEGVLAGAVDQAGGQGLQEAVEQRRVVAGRQHQVGAPGIGQQADAHAALASDQVMHLVLGRVQAAGCQV